MLDVPAPPVGYVGPTILGECLYNVNDLRNAPGKQGLELAKWIIHKVSQSMISTVHVNDFHSPIQPGERELGIPCLVR